MIPVNAVKKAWAEAGKPGSLKSWARSFSEDDELWPTVSIWFQDKVRPALSRKKRGPAKQPRKKACAMVGIHRKPRKKGKKKR